MKKTYLFYDIETSGLNPAFDQVLQFAAIRTDKDLNEIARHEIRVALRKDVLPAPEAVITHMISLENMQQGISEVVGIQQIHQLLNEPGTISVGYNTLGFDDEFLRFSFYRNLFTPYTHQYANECSRMDIYPILIFYYLFAKDGINWPMRDNKLSLKLEELIVHNQLAEGQAHDAMVDVQATVALAKLLKRNKEMWEYCCDYFSKEKELTRLNKWGLFQADHIGLYIDPAFGVNNNFLAPVVCLGQHWHYKNQWLFLRLDLPELQQVAADEINKNTWVMRKKMAEPGFLLPASDRYLEKLTAERKNTLIENKKWLLDNVEYFKKISDYHLDYKYPIVPQADVDSVLYQTGFFSSDDVRCCYDFHQADILHKINLLEKFNNPDLRDLAWRLLGRNYFEILPENMREDFQLYLQKAGSESCIDYRGQERLSMEKVLQTIDRLRVERILSDAQKKLLNEYEYWLKEKT